MTSSGASLTESARNFDVGMGLGDLADHARTAAGGHVHVDENDVGNPFTNHLHGRVDVRRRADDVDDIAELRAHTREEELMVVDEEHAGRGRHGDSTAFANGSTNSTSVPVSADDRTDARPPARVMRPMME